MMVSVAALEALGATGRAVAALRQHTVLPAVAAYESVQRSTATARALAEFSAEIGRIPDTIIRKALP
jgi:hypothetical protein